MAGYKDLVEQDVVDMLIGVTPTSGITYSNTYLLGFYLSDPTDSTTGAEVTGGSYARQSITVSRSGNTLVNTNTITFPEATADWGTIVAFALIDSVSGEQVMYGPLTPSKAVVTGETLTIKPGQFIQTVD
ncbi:MAG: hypothetical protein HRU21_10575 [Pseudomonadales bacterium]|nr:hypothetical protein [Pseudomonadales bacterium]